MRMPAKIGWALPPALVTGSAVKIKKRIIVIAAQIAAIT
jgi:hypothetical protein